MQQTNKQ